MNNTIVTADMIKAALNKAVDLNALPRLSAPGGHTKAWRDMREILQAALNATNREGLANDSD